MASNGLVSGRVSWRCALACLAFVTAAQGHAQSRAPRIDDAALTAGLTVVVVLPTPPF
jgi:hypothetical protein